ncbi:MAG: hypothetical protein PHV89_08290 [Fermentimonas sp.]|nr:hypothetical protein [Fermentimonas sp.]
MKQLIKFFVLVLIVVFISCSDNEDIWVIPEFPQNTDVSMLDM